ncbi:MAG TPA: hypothetical protein VF146_16050, partial [Bryobacteraceae bacterium]
GEAPRVVWPCIRQLLWGDQRKKIVWFAIGVKFLADGVVDRAQVNYHRGFHVAEGDAEEKESEDYPAHEIIQAQVFL